MPPTQRGEAYRLGPNRWGLRYYDAAGKRRRKSPFLSKSAALDHYATVIAPQLRGDAVALPELTLGAFVPLYLERHAATVRPRTIQTLRERLPHAESAFGDVPLRPNPELLQQLGLIWCSSSCGRRRRYLRARVLWSGARCGRGRS